MRDWDKLEAACKNAALEEVKPSEPKKPKKLQKTLRAFPSDLFEEYKRQYENNLTSLSFSSFMYEAAREKLERNKHK